MKRSATAQPGDGKVYESDGRLLIWYYSARKNPKTGRWKREFLRTGLEVNAANQKKAEAALTRIRLDVQKELVTGVPQGPLTLGRYLDGWLTGRERDGVGSVDDDRSRLKHAASIKGLLMEELTPDHFLTLVRELKARIGPAKGDMAPRTVRHVYFLLRQALNDAVADKIIPANPCVVKKKEVPKKRDKDPFWRETAVFTHEEREQLISDERIPEERRTLYGILFGGGPRISEVSALQVRDYNAKREPLGCLYVSKSYNRKKKKVKGVKTDNPRTVPVHPTLAKLLAKWLLGGWERYMGRPPKPDDLLLPSGAGPTVHLKDNTAHANLLQDLEVVGMRSRRTHDSRRAFISLGIADGARKEILKWISHGPTGDIMDDYTTLPWETLCAEIGKMRLELREGRIVQLRRVGNGGCDTSCDTTSDDFEIKGEIMHLEAENAVPRAGLESDFASTAELAQAQSQQGNHRFASVTSRFNKQLSQGTVTLSQQQRRDIGLVLRGAATEWAEAEDTKRLFESLGAILDVIEGER